MYSFRLDRRNRLIEQTDDSPDWSAGDLESF